MQPETLLSYYPTYSILDEIVQRGNYDTLNIFIDLKNNLQTLYMEHAVIGIVEATNQSKRWDASIFISFMNFISFHKKYAVKRNIKVNFYVFFETGTSVYHKNIRKKYKIRRHTDDLYGLDRTNRELFTKVVQKNLQLIEKLGNTMPNVKVIRLHNLEADFVPYLLISRKMVDRSSNVANLTYSNDHDLYQNLLDKNCFNFIKNKKKRTIVAKNEVMSTYVKKPISLPDEYLPVLMAIMGDPGDDVDGIKGIGPNRAASIVEDVIKDAGGLRNLYENVGNNKEIFTDDIKNQNKYMKLVYDNETEHKLISDNLKLVSFELISRAFVNPNTTEMMERRDKFANFYRSKKRITSYHELVNGLSDLRIYVDDDVLQSMYF